jgi:hypothetical protein
MSSTREIGQIEAALEALPRNCPYHGSKLDPPDPWRISCCDSGIPAVKRRTAEAALKRLSERVWS